LTCKEADTEITFKPDGTWVIGDMYYIIAITISCVVCGGRVFSIKVHIVYRCIVIGERRMEEILQVGGEVTDIIRVRPAEEVEQ